MAYMKSRREFLKQAGLYSAISLPVSNALGYQAGRQSDSQGSLAETENKLYQMTIVLFDNIYGNKKYTEYAKKRGLKFYEETHGGKRFYVLRNSHLTRLPVDYAHDKIMPLIRDNPQKWLIISYMPKVNVDDPSFNPAHYYFKGLGRIFSVPFENAQLDYTEDEVVSQLIARFMTEGFVKEFNTDLWMRIIEQNLLISQLSVYDDEFSEAQTKDSSDYLRDVSKFFGFSDDKLKSLLSDYQKDKSALDKNDMFMKTWNKLGDKKFQEIIKKYPNRDSVLLNVGIDTSPAFR